MKSGHALYHPGERVGMHGGSFFPKWPLFVRFFCHENIQLNPFSCYQTTEVSKEIAYTYLNIDAEKPFSGMLNNVYVCM